MADGPAYYSAQMNISQNDDWIVPFQYSSIGTDGVTLTPVDLTGSVMKLQIRKVEAEHEAIVSVMSPTDITFDNAKQGQFTIHILRDKLARLPPGDYVSDLVRLMTSGWQERIFSATVTVVQGTSR